MSGQGLSARSMRTFPVGEMTDPRGKGMVQIYEDYWWAVSEGEGLYFFGTNSSPHLAPQCNRHEQIAVAVAQKGLIKELGNLKEVRQIPLVFVPVLIEDYI